MDTKKRCAWVNLKNPHYVAYHDREWCVPTLDEKKLFEFIVLESAQAGLSWETILNRREGYRKAFKNFDPLKVLKMTDRNIEKLMSDTGIIRNRLKIKATITNAHSFHAIQNEFGAFFKYLQFFINKKHSKMDIHTIVPAMIAKDMKKRGFKFFGPTICYAYMQAVGLVDDHSPDCYKFKQN